MGERDEFRGDTPQPALGKTLGDALLEFFGRLDDQPRIEAAVAASVSRMLAISGPGPGALVR